MSELHTALCREVWTMLEQGRVMPERIPPQALRALIAWNDHNAEPSRIDAGELPGLVRTIIADNGHYPHHEAMLRGEHVGSRLAALAQAAAELAGQINAHPELDGTTTSAEFAALFDGDDPLAYLDDLDARCAVYTTRARALFLCAIEPDDIAHVDMWRTLDGMGYFRKRGQTMPTSNRPDSALQYMLPRCAWTGGDPPRPYRDTSRQERALVREAFREAMRASVDYWGDGAALCFDESGRKSTLDNARIQWKRARYDAHATIRNAHERACTAQCRELSLRRTREPRFKGLALARKLHSSNRRQHRSIRP